MAESSSAADPPKPVCLVLSQKQHAADPQHYAKTFPVRVVRALSVGLLVSAGVAVTVQIVLLVTGDPQISPVPVTLAPGLWAAICGALTGCIGWLAAHRPTKCTLPAALSMAILSSVLGLCVVVISTLGIVATKNEQLSIEEGKNDPNLILFLKPMFPMQPPSVVQLQHNSGDKELHEAEVANALADLRTLLVCQSILVLASIVEVVLSVMMLILGCRASRLTRPIRPETLALTNTVLYSTRNEREQSSGFVSIPVPTGLYTVTGDTLDRNGELPSADGARANPALDVSDEVTGSKDDPPPKYEDASHVANLAEENHM